MDIIIYVIILALFALIPSVLDIVFAYISLNKIRNRLIDKAPDRMELKELQEFIKESGQAPTGIRGLSRSTIALTVIVILGIAVFHILVNGIGSTHTADNNTQINMIINNVLSMLAGLLAAITGFYFGGKAAEERKKEEGSKAPLPRRGASKNK
jgi:H+/gluconate symporter-like permease